MASSSMKGKPSFPNSTDFDFSIYPPRDPTPGERTKLLLRFDGNSVDIYAVPLKIMGDPTAAYNSLGWAVQLLCSIPNNPLYYKPDNYNAYMARIGYEPVSDPDLATIEVFGQAFEDGIHVMSFSRRIGGRKKCMWKTKRGSEELIVHDRYDWRAFALGPSCRVLRGYRERDGVLMARTMAGLVLLLPDDDTQPMEWLSLKTGETPRERYENCQLLKEANAIVARASAGGSSSLADHVRPQASTHSSFGTPVNEVPSPASPQPEMHHPPSQHGATVSGARGYGDWGGMPGRGVESSARDWEPQGTQERGTNPAELPKVLRSERSGLITSRQQASKGEELRAVYAVQDSRAVPHGFTETTRGPPPGAPRGPSRGAPRR